mmetsp:Transcript_554/g.1747  ORF Transcript_554/g.1747 Transcript_554/m.1747 type:complete len:227 (+) Transcript_554:1592-2272(+)
MPAVSNRVTFTPLTFTAASTTSLVVPSTSVTIDRSLFVHRFNNLDFPAFGRPTIASVHPTDKLAFFCDVFNALNATSFASSTSFAILSTSRGTISSSKSNRASNSAKTSIILLLASLTSLDKPPLNVFSACTAASSVSARINECTASACDKSNLPFKNARMVNSPFLANRHAFVRKHASNTLAAHTDPPCVCISTTSSAVYDRGFSIGKRRTSSITSPSLLFTIVP